MQPFRYRVYVYDEEIELYYLISRYYAVAPSRFINSDIYIGPVGSLFNCNLFAYCLNTPISMHDDDGDVPSVAARVLIHNAVCLDVCETVPGMVGGIGMKVVYGAPINNKTYGYYDLVNIYTNEAYEVKRSTLSVDTATRQLGNYIDATWVGFLRYFPEQLQENIPKLHPGNNNLIRGSFIFKEAYEVTYWFERDGIILYDYTRLSSSSEPALAQEALARAPSKKANLPTLPANAWQVAVAAGTTVLAAGAIMFALQYCLCGANCSYPKLKGGHS